MSGADRAPRSGRAFGLDLRTQVPLAGLRAPLGDGRALAIVVATAAGVDSAWSGSADDPLLAATTIDGRPYLAERGRDGDLLITVGAADRLHLSAAADELLVAGADSGDPALLRALSDSVLATVAHERGYELLHATGVRIGGRLVAIAAPSGGGKSTLAAALLAAGATLATDDLLALGRDARGAVVAHPGPALMTLPDGAPSPAGARELAHVGEERWIELPAGAAADAAPVPLAAIVLLERAAEHGSELAERLTPSPLTLLRHLVPYRADAARARLRFDLAGDLASSCALVRLRAGLGVAPADLAAVLTQAVAGLRDDSVALSP